VEIVVDEVTDDDDLMFTMNINNPSTTNGNGSHTNGHGNGNGGDDESKNDTHNMNIEKMDEMMGLLLQYLSLVRASSNGVLCDEVFHSLLRVFDTAILRTHKVST
jgi:hypothetical protein